MNEYNLELDFRTDMNRTWRLVVPRVKSAVTLSEVQSVMNLICQKGTAGSVSSAVGKPESILAASLVSRETINYNMNS